MGPDRTWILEMEDLTTFKCLQEEAKGKGQGDCTGKREGTLIKPGFQGLGEKILRGQVEG